MSKGSQVDWGGVIFGLMCAVVGFGVAYWLWPDGVMDKSIASVTLREAFKVIGSIFAGLFGVGGVALSIRDV
jgi:hypothetical protein